MSKIVKIVKFVKNCQNCQNCKICQNCQKLSKSSKNCQNCQNVSQVMFPHHCDQISQMSLVSRVALNKRWVTHSVSEWVTRSPFELFWTAKKMRCISAELTLICRTPQSKVMAKNLLIENHLCIFPVQMENSLKKRNTFSWQVSEQIQALLF